MLKIVISLLGWVPGLGETLKIAYIANCAREVASKVKIDESKANLKGEELEEYVIEMATSAYEEHLQEEVEKLGLPEFATSKASEKAIEIISAKIRENYQQRVV